MAGCLLLLPNLNLFSLDRLLRYAKASKNKSNILFKIFLTKGHCNFFFKIFSCCCTDRSVFPVCASFIKATSSQIPRLGLYLWWIIILAPLSSPPPTPLSLNLLSSQFSHDNKPADPSLAAPRHVDLMFNWDRAIQLDQSVYFLFSINLSLFLSQSIFLLHHYM